MAENEKQNMPDIAVTIGGKRVPPFIAYVFAGLLAGGGFGFVGGSLPDKRIDPYTGSQGHAEALARAAADKAIIERLHRLEVLVEKSDIDQRAHHEEAEGWKQRIIHCEQDCRK